MTTTVRAQVSYAHNELGAAAIGVSLLDDSTLEFVQGESGDSYGFVVGEDGRHELRVMTWKVPSDTHSDVLRRAYLAYGSAVRRELNQAVTRTRSGDPFVVHLYEPHFRYQEELYQLLKRKGRP